MDSSPVSGRGAITGWHNEPFRPKRMKWFFFCIGKACSRVAQRTVSPLGEGYLLWDETVLYLQEVVMKVKICGIRNLETALVAEQCGADFLGFIFYPESHRYIEPKQAAAITARLTQAKKVGVFVDESWREVNRIIRMADLDYVQLHGRESAEYAERMEAPVIKAWRWGDGFTAEKANAFPSELILVDTFVKGKAGGTGESFSWAEASEELGKLQKPWLLAGGISADNVKEAADILHPFGVDVSGSLEIKGKKSAEKIEEFLERMDREGLR